MKKTKHYSKITQKMNDRFWKDLCKWMEIKYYACFIATILRCQVTWIGQDYSKLSEEILLQRL